MKIGIDFGMDYCRVGYVDSLGETRTIETPVIMLTGRAFAYAAFTLRDSL